MPEQDPSYYASMTHTYPVASSGSSSDSADPGSYGADSASASGRNRRANNGRRIPLYPGLEKLVMRGCDPRHELTVAEDPLAAANKFGIKLSKKERDMLQARPRGIAVAIGEMYWTLNDARERLTPVEKLLLKGNDERYSEIVHNDPVGSARQFRIKIREVDQVILAGIRRQDLSRAIKAAQKHLMLDGKPHIGQRIRLQLGRRGRTLTLCTKPRVGRDPLPKKLEPLLTLLFDEAMPLPELPEIGWYFRDADDKAYFAKRRRQQRQQERAERARARRAERRKHRRGGRGQKRGGRFKRRDRAGANSGSGGGGRGRSKSGSGGPNRSRDRNRSSASSGDRNNRSRGPRRDRSSSDSRSSSGGSRRDERGSRSRSNRPNRSGSGRSSGGGRPRTQRD